MDQIYPDDGLLVILTRIVTPGLTWHLFRNDVVPSLADDVTTYAEAAWSGYAPITVPVADFTFDTVSAHVGQVTADFLAFLNTSGTAQLIYGYYVTDATNTVLIAAARFDDAPVTLPDGQTQSVLPGIANFSALSS